jgi:diguanylate cyclase (GGDEF)-like protein/PAS domain S-box-containing protein
MTLSKRLSYSFASILIASLLATAWSLLALQRTHASNESTSSSLLPFVQDTETFERETLNARISFIYYATIQKPNSLERGWARYHNAEAMLARLQTQTASDPSLALLRPRVETLSDNLRDYSVHLEQVLALVQQGPRAGPEYNATIAEWAAAGDRLVTTARDLGDNAAWLSRAETGNTSFLLRLTVVVVAVTQALGIGVGVVLAWMFLRDFGRRRRGMTQRQRGWQPSAEMQNALSFASRGSLQSSPGRTSRAAQMGAALALISAAIVIATGTVAVRRTRDLTQAQSDVLHSQQVLADAEALKALASEAESGTDAYLLSMGTASLDFQQASIRRALERADKLYAESRNSDQQQARLAEIKQELHTEFQDLQFRTNVRRTQGLAAAQRLVAGEEGSSGLRQVQDRIGALESAEKDILLEHTLEAQREALISKALVFFAALPAALGLAISGLVTAHLLRRSVRLQGRLWEVNGTLNTLLETAPVGIFNVNANGTIGFWNPAAERIFGIGLEELRDKEVATEFPELARVLRSLQRSQAKIQLGEEDAGLTDRIVSWQRPGSEPAKLHVSMAAVGREGEGATEMVAIAQDVTAYLNLQEELTHVAHYDALTGLPNRVLLEERCDQMVEHAQQKGTVCAMLAIDLDCFKKINARYGNHVGDVFLQHAVKQMQGVLRNSDTLMRVGGDEFLCLVQMLRDDADAELIAGKLVASLAQPITIGESLVQGSVSIGVAVFPEDGKSPEELRRNADGALSKAKLAGRNQFRRYGQDEAERRRSFIQASLPQALEQGHFLLVYQPQYSVGGTLRGFEALLRLRHPTLGPLYPAEFIPIAEQSGLILPLGSWVLQDACETFVEWLECGLRPGVLSVNVSAAQFTSGKFAATVEQILKRTGLAAEHLELELTESMIMTDVADSAQEMERLKRAGVRIAIDDFGTGYSSLSHLHHLPIDTLKIDRSFIDQLDAASSTRPIVESVVALGKTLEIQTVAEGVETAEQRQYLTDIGCDFLQGYLLARPLAPADAELRLRSAAAAAAHPVDARTTRPFLLQDAG